MCYCRFCGRQILDNAAFCDGCGKRQSFEPVQQFDRFMNDVGNAFDQATNDIKKNSTMALISLCCGIASFVFGAFPAGIAAIIFAFISRSEAKGEFSNYAKIGLICGSISTALTILVMAFYVIYIVFLTGISISIF